jgi:hypothetical protein
VRRKLGELYLGALRPADYERNLDVLLALEPGEDLLRELAGRVASTNDPAARKRILGIFSQQEPEGSAADVEELARLLAAEGKLAEAAHELLAREQYLSATGQALLLNLLLDLGRDREAETVAGAWVEREPSGERLDRLIDAVQDTGKGRLALHLLDRWHDHLPPSDARLISHAGLLAAHRHEAEARSMIERRLESGRPVEPGLVSALLEAAWAAGLSEHVRTEALARPAEHLSDRLLASLLDTALQTGDRPFIDRLLAHAGR